MLSTGKVKLLIVDDEPIVVEIVVKMLSPCEYEMRTAFNGEEAVLIAKEFRPDCIVTGFMMPRMDRIEEARAILQFQPACKFIFVTGNSDNPTVREVYERVGLDLKLLLPKPFARADLLNALALAGFPCSSDS